MIFCVCILLFGFSALFIKPSDCLPAVGTVFRDPSLDFFHSTRIVPVEAKIGFAGGLVNSSVCFKNLVSNSDKMYNCNVERRAPVKPLLTEHLFRKVTSLPSANEVVGRLCFQSCLSFGSREGGGGEHMWPLSTMHWTSPYSPPCPQPNMGPHCTKISLALGMPPC